jgi:hypothetical protein
MRWGFHFTFAMFVVAALAVLAPTPPVYAQDTLAAQNEATDIFSKTDDQLAAAMAAAAPANCAGPQTKHALADYVAQSISELDNLAAQNPSPARPPRSITDTPDVPRNVAWMKQSLTASLDRYLALPPCIPPPGPNVTTGPSSPPAGGGGTGGGSGGDEGPQPPSGGTGSGPEMPPPADKDCPGANSEEIKKLEAEIAKAANQVQHDQDNLDIDLKLQDSLERHVASLEASMQHPIPGTQESAESSQFWQDALDAERAQLEQAKRDVLGDRSDLNSDSNRLQNLKEDLAKLKKKACGDQSNSGFLHDILGHVSIGVGVGIGGGHDDRGDRGGDRGSDSGTPHD